MVSDTSDESFGGALGTAKSALLKEVTTLNRRQDMVSFYHVGCLKYIVFISMPTAMCISTPTWQVWIEVLQFEGQ